MNRLNFAIALQQVNYSTHLQDAHSKLNVLIIIIHASVAVKCI